MSIKLRIGNRNYNDDSDIREINVKFVIPPRYRAVQNGSNTYILIPCTFGNIKSTLIVPESKIRDWIIFREKSKEINYDLVLANNKGEQIFRIIVKFLPITHPENKNAVFVVIKQEGNYRFSCRES